MDVLRKMLNKHLVAEERFDRLQSLISSYGSNGRLVVANMYINDRWVPITSRDIGDIFERLIVKTHHLHYRYFAKYRLIAYDQVGYDQYGGLKVHEDGYMYFNSTFPFRDYDDLPILSYRDDTFQQISVVFTAETRYRYSFP